MRLDDLTEKQITQYFQARLPEARFRTGSKQVVRCPFHDDRQASLSLELSEGMWNCHAGCGSGKLLAFEMRWANTDDKQEALERIFETVGMEYTGYFYSKKPEAIYNYRNALGNLVFQKVRYPGKKFVQRQPKPDGTWQYKLDAALRRPLYNLPEVITANVVGSFEGEKDCDNVNVLKLDELDPTGKTRFVATTNFDGAGHWRPYYSPFFSGKTVLVFPDFDEKGMAHALAVARSVSEYADSVRIVELPGLVEHGDVSDYLQTHGREELWREMWRAPVWTPPPSPLLVNGKVFLSRSKPEIDWLVDDVIERGANGVIVSDPHVGKSFVAVDLVLSLALGMPWLGFSVPVRTRVALITREDNADRTSWRMGHILHGKGGVKEDLEEWLWVNTKDDSPRFRLDNPEELSAMIAALQQHRPVLTILDVFNVVHGSDENDQSEMRKILDLATELARQVGCSLGILHHFNKETKGRLVQRIRGSTAIAGWAEWVIGLKYASQKADEKVRIMEFDLKSGSVDHPLRFTINDLRTEGAGVRVERVEREESDAARKGRSGRYTTPYKEE
jgi:hypothetical protein